mgnify:FL=1|jgi:hypothetical protein|tara:strand:+ start:1657 stop:1926 length:270 start_codon:yes stop_codon:yes gene_type:complete
MTQRWLRHVNDGFIYGWDHYLAQNPLVEEVTEEQAFPERFLKPAQVKRAKVVRAKSKSTLDLTTESVVYAAPATTDPELAADASRGLPE